MTIKALSIEVFSLSGRSRTNAGTLMNSSDELVERVRRGDDEAFRLIFERYHRPIISFIYDLVGDCGLAEELMQEAFMRAYRNVNALRDQTKLAVWLFGIAKNVARESLRARRQQGYQVEMDDRTVTQLHDGSLSPDEQLFSKELSRAIHEALATLDQDKRMVFTLKVFQQKSYQEIAEITEFSIAKIKSDLHRARMEMRSLLRPSTEASYEM